jgi:hypothetical protein
MSSASSGDAVTESDEDEDAARAHRVEQYRRQLVEALERYRPVGGSPWNRPIPEHLVNLLFRFLLESEGEEAARYWFVEQGRSKKPREQSDIANWALLQLYDVQKEALGDTFSIMQFVNQQVEANKNLPKSERRGAGGTNSADLYHHLNDLLKKREANKRQKAQLHRQRQLRQLREGVDIWRRKLAEVSAAFARASSKVLQNIKSDNNLA